MTEIESDRALSFPWEKVTAQMKVAVETVLKKSPINIGTDKGITVLLNAPENNQGFYCSKAIYRRGGNNNRGNIEIQKLYRSGTNNWLPIIFTGEDARLPVIADEVMAGRLKAVSTTIAAWGEGFTLQSLKEKCLVFELHLITPPARKVLYMPGTIIRREH